MNHIAQVLDTKLKSSTKNGILSTESTESPRIFQFGSWKSIMLLKVKECRDAIKNMIAFDKLPNNTETPQRATSTNETSFSPNVSRPKTSSLPDIITFSSIVMKDREHENEEILTRNSTLNLNEKEMNTFTEVNDSLNHSLTNNTISSSLKSFLMLEKQVMEKYPNEEKVSPMKKKISAEPFLTYTEETAEFVWADDTENSSPNRVWNSFEHLNFSDINFENPRMNSTLCEYSLPSKNRTSSPIRNYDSGFENHFSI